MGTIKLCSQSQQIRYTQVRRMVYSLIMLDKLLKAKFALLATPLF